MKRNLRRIILSVVFPAMTFTAAAQYQLPNPGFEGTWNSVTQNKVTGTEPTGWHSFVTMETKSSTYESARSNKIQVSSDVRPGSAGVQSAKIWSNSITVIFWTIVANGNLTTGRIYGGSTTATEASGNYNFSDPTATGYNQTFTGKPDSLVSWVKFVPKNTAEQARISAIIHESSRYQDPEAKSYTNVVAKAQRDYNATSDKGWQRQAIPFAYESGSKTPAYILLSYTTNKTPGEGDANDAVYIDDIEMVYNSKAASVKFDGTALSGFSKDKYNYDRVKWATGIPATVEATVDGVSATYAVNKNAAGKSVTLTVSGGDISANAANKHIYTFAFVNKVDVAATTSNASWGTASFTHSDTGSDVYEGEDVTFTATPTAAGYFVNWTDGSGAVVSTSAVYEVKNISANMSLKANFIAKKNSNISFAQKDVTVNKTDAAGGKYLQAATVSDSKGAVTYSIDNTSVASINASTGELTLKGLGKAVVTATQAASAEYLETKTTYNVWVKDYNAVNFSTPTASVYLYQGEYTQVANDPNATGGITYSVTPGSANVSSSGKVTFSSAGNYTVTATQAANGNYVETKATYRLTVNVNPKFKVTADMTPAGSGTTYVDGMYGDNDVEYGKSASLEANANAGYQFVKWTKDGSDVSTSAIFATDPITQISTYVAVFVGTTKSDLAFENTNAVITVGYESGNTHVNAAASSVSQGAITYSSNNPAMTVDNSGTVTMTAKGTATITAKQAAWGRYAETTVSYVLNAVDPVAPSIRWKDAGPVTKDQGEGSYTPELLTNSNGAITYKSDNESVATIDTDGKVTLINKGEANITANQARATGNGWLYGPGSASFLLQIVPTGIDNSELAAVKVWISGGMLNIDGVQQGDKVKVFTSNGTMIYDGVASGSTMSVDIPSNGLIIVKINGNAFKVVK